ncbi:hypothetical protein Bca52824_035310 [Brassica carinata]|uniref:Protein RED C-terminal domain-containing protein n=1 Tax=Brassica carinata TaxID=52824 RepID=A0A8X7S0E0_BRACI|nr:hypothetical protein Bca52824_035310 [Brassica carinata]
MLKERRQLLLMDMMKTVINLRLRMDLRTLVKGKFASSSAITRWDQPYGFEVDMVKCILKDWLPVSGDWQDYQYAEQTGYQEPYLQPGMEGYVAQPETGERHTGERSSFVSESYSECYPGYQEYNHEVVGSDEEADLSKMDMGGKAKELYIDGILRRKRNGKNIMNRRKRCKSSVPVWGKDARRTGCGIRDWQDYQHREKTGYQEQYIQPGMEVTFPNQKLVFYKILNLCLRKRKIGVWDQCSSVMTKGFNS